MEVPKKHWTTTIGQATGHPAAFGVVLLYALLWLVFDAVTFDWNAVATMGVWMMTLFIQRSNRRDTQALHAKLDELMRVDNDARTELTRLDEQEPEDIKKTSGYRGSEDNGTIIPNCISQTRMPNPTSKRWGRCPQTKVCRMIALNRAKRAFTQGPAAGKCHQFASDVSGRFLTHANDIGLDCT